MLIVPHFVDRHDAGRRLGDLLARYVHDRPLIVLGLPRGGVPVAAAVAEALDSPLGLFVVRKLGVPGQPEYAMGAIASGGTQALNRRVIEAEGISDEALERVIATERLELQRREELYGVSAALPVLAGETVVVVDDGAATGASMRATVHAIRQLSPRQIIAAVPVASRGAIAMLDAEADEAFSVIAPEPFYSVGAWYRDFAETTDAEVRSILGRARQRWDAAPQMVAGRCR